MIADQGQGERLPGCAYRFLGDGKNAASLKQIRAVLLREIQELLRHKNIRTTVRYTHVGYEQTRQTAEALSQVLE